MPIFFLFFAMVFAMKPKQTIRLLRYEVKSIIFGGTFIGIGLLRYYINPIPELLHNHIIDGAICILLWFFIVTLIKIFPETIDAIRWICLVVFGLSLGLGIPLLIEQPGIARLTMGNPSESTYIAMYFPRGIANYTWYTFGALAWPVMANWLYNNHQNIIAKLIGWASLILLATSVILSTFAMALVLQIIGCLVWLFLVLLTVRKPLVRFILVGLLVFIIINATTLYSLGSQYPSISPTLEKATHFLSEFFETKSLADSDPTIRTSLLIGSWNTFKQYPILGAWGFTPHFLVGWHSSWADTLAVYGLVGAFLWLGFLSSSWLRGRNPFSVSAGKAGGTLAWFLLFFSAVYNPLFYSGLGMMMLWLFDEKNRSSKPNREFSEARSQLIQGRWG